MTTILYMFWTGFSGASVVNHPARFVAAQRYLPGVKQAVEFHPATPAKAQRFQPGMQEAETTTE